MIPLMQLPASRAVAYYWCIMANETPGETGEAAPSATRLAECETCGQPCSHGEILAWGQCGSCQMRPLSEPGFGGDTGESVEEELDAGRRAIAEARRRLRRLPDGTSQTSDLIKDETAKPTQG